MDQDLTTIEGLASVVKDLQNQFGQSQAATTELSRLQFYQSQQTPQTTQSTTQTTSSSSASSTTGLNATFVAPVSLFSIVGAPLVWTTYSLVSAVPRNAKFIIVEYSLGSSGAADVTMNARVNSSTSQARLVSFSQHTNPQTMKGQVAILPIDTSALAIDFEVLGTDGSAVLIVSCIGYWY